MPAWPFAAGGGATGSWPGFGALTGGAPQGLPGGLPFAIPGFPASDPANTPQALWARWQEQWQKGARDWMGGLEGRGLPAMPASVHVDPSRMEALQKEFAQRSEALWKRFVSGDAPDLSDRRFASPAWKEQNHHAWAATWYLLHAEFLQRLAESVDGDRQVRDRIRFAVQQYVDAWSPANFLATNPDALAKAVSSQGESLRQGMMNLLGDMQQGRISQTDWSAFEVGRNVGTSPGQVVYENDLIQLIQYTPTTPTVGERPLLIVPPCINKFYILDLQPDNSFIRHAVSQGNTVFLVSWRNADASVQTRTWDDYLDQGILEAIDVTRDIADVEQINVLGFCVGGTLLTTALAVAAARGEKPAASLTLLTTFLDFEDTGVLGIFIDEMQVAMREQMIGSGGILSGRELATTFSFLRPNDLVWNYVVNNYLKGESPPAFDLLYWNGDSTNLPGPMFCWYLRHTYLQNDLVKPDAVTCLGQPVDLRRVDIPTYVLCAREDHIVPWEGAFRSARALGSDPRFVVGASGHIAGVVNPATRNRRSFRTGPSIAGTDARTWMEASTEHPGSWWTDWSKWLAAHQGESLPAPEHEGSEDYPAIEPAPGRYVRQQAV